MPIYNLDEIVAYEQKGGSKLLCSDCLDKLPEEQQKLSLWNIISEDEVEKEPVMTKEAKTILNDLYQLLRKKKEIV